MPDALLSLIATYAPFCVAAAVFVTAVGAFYLVEPVGTRLAQQAATAYDDGFVDHLQFPQMPLVAFQAGLIGLVVVSVGALVVLPIAQGIALVVLLLLSVFVMPKLVFALLKAQRRKKIDAVLPNVLQQLAANFRSTSDISRALFEVIETAPAPMDHELRLIRQKENDLKSFPDALDQARRRIGSDWFDVVAAVLKTTYENGGKEAQALMNLSRVFVQLTKMRERIDTATSQGRMSMRIIMLMPFFVIAIAVLVVPDIAADAWASFVGKFVLGLAALFYIVAVASAIWLSSVKI